jgi:hypothetical protein
MSYYTTGSSFSLKTGTHFPRIIYNNNGITSSRTSGVIAPSDPQTNGPASTSVFMEASINSNGTLNAERLAEEFADKIEPHLSSVGSISTPHLSTVGSISTAVSISTPNLLTSMLFLGLQATPLPNIRRVAAFNGGYITSDVFSNPSIINSIDCSVNGQYIVGISSITNSLYISTDRGKTFKNQYIGIGNYIQVRMTVDTTDEKNYFTVLDTDGKIYFYYINNNVITFSIRDWASYSSNPVKNELRCLSISSDGSKQFVFDQSSVIWTLTVNTSNIGPTTDPVTNVKQSIVTAYLLPVVWDSCACSSDGNTQIAVGFVQNGDCYVFSTNSMWGSYYHSKINRRATTKNINYGTTSFISSDGSKQWCIIDGQLYYRKITYTPEIDFEGKPYTANNFADNFTLIPNPTGYFISNGTTATSGSVLYLIKDDGSLWRSFDDGNTLIAL